MRKFVLDILKEKEAEYDAERKQGSYGLLKSLLLEARKSGIWFACNNVTCNVMVMRLY